MRLAVLITTLIVVLVGFNSLTGVAAETQELPEGVFVSADNSIKQIQFLAAATLSQMGYDTIDANHSKRKESITSSAVEISAIHYFEAVNRETQESVIFEGPGKIILESHRSDWTSDIDITLYSRLNTKTILFIKSHTEGMHHLKWMSTRVDASLLLDGVIWPNLVIHTDSISKIRMIENQGTLIHGVGNVLDLTGFMEDSNPGTKTTVENFEQIYIGSEHSIVTTTIEAEKQPDGAIQWSMLEMTSNPKVALIQKFSQKYRTRRTTNGFLEKKFINANFEMLSWQYDTLKDTFRERSQEFTLLTASEENIVLNESSYENISTFKLSDDNANILKIKTKTTIASEQGGVLRKQQSTVAASINGTSLYTGSAYITYDAQITVGRVFAAAGACALAAKGGAIAGGFIGGEAGTITLPIVGTVAGVAAGGAIGGVIGCVAGAGAIIFFGDVELIGGENEGESSNQAEGSAIACKSTEVVNGVNDQPCINIKTNTGTIVIVEESQALHEKQEEAIQEALRLAAQEAVIERASQCDTSTPFKVIDKLQIAPDTWAFTLQFGKNCGFHEIEVRGGVVILDRIVEPNTCEALGSCTFSSIFDFGVASRGVFVPIGSQVTITLIRIADGAKETVTFS